LFLFLNLKSPKNCSQTEVSLGRGWRTAENNGENEGRKRKKTLVLLVKEVVVAASKVAPSLRLKNIQKIYG